jgi:hypothetical protein
MSNFSILVNTCDKFEDCWDPFFKLFKIYWPDYNGKIYLNTELKDYSYPELNIIALKVAEYTDHNKRLTWSDCLIKALEKIDTEIVLYLQEDYFLRDSVKNEFVEKYVQLMNDNHEVHCIHLTDQGSPAEKQSPLDGLYTIPKVNQDRISCQAALWQKSILLQYLKPYESGWNFEWFGSKRAAILNHNFYVVDPNWVKINKFEILPYIFTGIIGGRWFREVLPLFKKHDINIDYTKRGFFERETQTFSKKINAKIKRLPLEIRCNIDLFKLKLERN